jgi:hypothetical protein
MCPVNDSKMKSYCFFPQRSTINFWIWNSWRIFIIGCLQAHRRRRESETERAWIIRVTYRLEFVLCTVNDSKIKSYCLFPQSFSSVKIQIFLVCNDFRHVFDIAIMQKWSY